MVIADRERVVAFRLAHHNLSRRRSARALVDIAAACGVQETPLGSAAIAFCARVEGLKPAALERALVAERKLVTVWSMRGAPYVVPARDLAVFTLGALPADRGSFRQWLGGWADALEAASLDPFEVLSRMISAAQALLDDRSYNVNELRDRIYARVHSLARVERPSFTRADMPEPLFRALGTSGAVCIVTGRGTDAELARTDRWLGEAPSGAYRSQARAELARRFLHCYGPAPARAFAEWTERSIADARDAFASIEDELVEVGGKRAVLLARDEGALRSPPRPSGVHLLPVGDPYLQARDRATLLPDELSRRRLWQAVRGPGAVLVGGDIVGTWRARTSGARLEVKIEPFRRLQRAERAAIQDETERLPPFRGHDSAAVTFVG